MTNEELIAKIKAEIERRIKAKADSIPTHGDMSIEDYITLGGMASLQYFLSFLSDLEKSEKSINQEGLDVTDFCKPIDPSIAQCIADHFWEMLGEDEKPIIPKDLEEAADKYLDKLFGKGKHQPFYKELFIAGAKLQKEQDDRLVDIIYQQGIEKGKDDMREQMLKDAVEGTVMDFSSNRPRPQVDVLLDPHKYHTGDKVRIIICKKED